MFPHVKLEEVQGVSVVRLRGQFIGGEETDNLRTVLAQSAEKQENTLVVDLEKATYLNSTALGVLISAHANFAKRGGSIALACISKSLENIFVITKLTLVFPIFATLEEALTKVSSK